MTILSEEMADRIQRNAAARYREANTRDLGRLVACSDGEFRPPIAAEAFEKAQNDGE